MRHVAALPQVVVAYGQHETYVKPAPRQASTADTLLANTEHAYFIEIRSEKDENVAPIMKLVAQSSVRSMYITYLNEVNRAPGARLNL